MVNIKRTSFQFSLSNGFFFCISWIPNAMDFQVKPKEEMHKNHTFKHQINLFPKKPSVRNDLLKINQFNTLKSFCIQFFFILLKHSITGAQSFPRILMNLTKIIGCHFVLHSQKTNNKKWKSQLKCLFIIKNQCFIVTRISLFWDCIVHLYFYRIIADVCWYYHTIFRIQYSLATW